MADAEKQGEKEEENRTVSNLQFSLQTRGIGCRNPPLPWQNRLLPSESFNQARPADDSTYLTIMIMFVVFTNHSPFLCVRSMRCLLAPTP